jgi:arginine N-succinyltransferase
MIDKQFIEDLMPQYPIYLELLPPRAIDAIGQVHEQAKPAYRLLTRQGFVQRDLVDIFDGGAVLHCETDRIQAIRCAQTSRVLEVHPLQTDAPKSNSGLVSVENPRFHCALGGWCEAGGDQVILDPSAAEALHIAVGDTVRLLPL